MINAIEIERFRAITDTGRKFTIIIFQEAAGLKKLFTSTGLSVKCIDQHTYQIVLTDEVLKRMK